MKRRSIGICLVIAFMTLFYGIPKADAHPAFYTTYCSSCHTVSSTCNGCHGHGTHSSSAKNDINVTGTTDKTSYAPGDTVSVTINGGYRTGWVRAILYDQNMTELARSTGPTGMGGGPGFPITLTAPAPAAPGTYTWNAAWYGNQFDNSDVAGFGTTFFGPRWTPDPNNPNHGQEIVSTNSFVVAVACVRSAPMVTLSPTAQNVAPGGSVTYAATVTNTDGTACSNSTFTLSVADTGTTADFVLPSTLSPTTCSNLAPGGTCSATLTVTATAALAAATNTTAVNADDSTNHSGMTGSSSVTTTKVPPACVRSAPTVTLSPTAQNVAPGGSVTYAATVTNTDGPTCSNSTLTLSVADTGTAADFVLPSTISPATCSNLAPGDTCSATLTVTATAGAANADTNTTTVSTADSTNHSALTGSGAVTTTVVVPPPVCTRSAPMVTLSPASSNVAPGGSVTYAATVTNTDGPTCNNSTFTLSVADTGTAANFVLPSTISPATCSNLAPGGTCSATLTVTATATAADGATNTTTINAADSTNHGSMTGSGSVTTTVTVPPPSGADFNILQFHATPEVQLSENRGRDGGYFGGWSSWEGQNNVVNFYLLVVNRSTVTGSAPATLVGMQHGVKVYSQTITVSAPAGISATYTFPSYRPTEEGTIYWTVTITEPTPNTATATTIVEREYGWNQH